MHRQRANAIVVQQRFLDGKGESIQFNALTDSCDIITGQVFCQFFINIYSLDSGIVLGSYGVPFVIFDFNVKRFPPFQASSEN